MCNLKVLFIWLYDIQFGTESWNHCYGSQVVQHLYTVSLRLVVTVSPWKSTKVNLVKATMDVEEKWKGFVFWGHWTCEQVVHGATVDQWDVATLFLGRSSISDEWAAYRKVSQHGYVHMTINHRELFAGPNNPEIHTQNIEKLWKDAKSYILRPGIWKEYYHWYLKKRYLF